MSASAFAMNTVLGANALNAAINAKLDLAGGTITGNLSVSGIVTSSFAGAIGSSTTASGAFTTISASAAASFAAGAFSGNLSVSGTATFVGATFTADVILTGTGEIQVPVGTTAQRSGTPALGMMRYNTDVAVKAFEGYSQTGWVPLGQAAFVNLGSPIPGGRLTLSSGVQVLLSTVSAAATLIYTPTIGNSIPLWNGTAFQATTFSELSNILANGATGSAGPLAASPNAVYDAFVWSNGGVPTLTRGDMWAKASPTSSSVVTISIASPAVVTWNAHNQAAGQPIQFSTTGALPTGIVAGTTYYVIAAGLSSNTFEFSATIGGSAVVTSGTQSGTQTCTASVAVTVAAPGVVSWLAHGLIAGCPVRFASTGTLPTGIAANTTYYVIAAGLATNAFEFSATIGGSAVTTTGSPTGVLSIVAGTGGQTVSNGLPGTETRGVSATAIVQGVEVNVNAIANGPAAGYGTLVGTIMTDATGATVTFNPGSAAAGGGAAWIGLWNRYNRRRIIAAVLPTNTSWTYTVGTWRAPLGSTTFSVSFVCGRLEDYIESKYIALANGASGTNVAVNVSIDSPSASGGAASGIGGNTTFSTSFQVTIVGTWVGQEPLGSHTLYAQELGATGASFLGFSGAQWAGLTADLQY